jgi:hypothetical protein
MTSGVHKLAQGRGLIGIYIALLIAAVAWWVRRRRVGERIAAAEARMEPVPVVY